MKIDPDPEDLPALDDSESDNEDLTDAKGNMGASDVESDNRLNDPHIVDDKSADQCDKSPNFVDNAPDIVKYSIDFLQNIINDLVNFEDSNLINLDDDSLQIRNRKEFVREVLGDARQV